MLRSAKPEQLRPTALKEKASPTVEEPRQAGETQSRRILVVDDSVDTAIGMARLLGMAGHEVEIAHDGNAAIEIARAYLPEVLLLEIGLPGLNGYEVASMLHQEEGLRTACSSRRQATVRASDPHVSKP